MDGLYTEFGRSLQKARKDSNLTQQQVADRVGLTRTSITNIERGRQHIALHQLYLLASALGCQPAELLPGQHVAGEELTLPAGAAEAFGGDEEMRDFAVRLLSKYSGVRAGNSGSVKK